MNTILKISTKQNAHYSDFPFWAKGATQVLRNLLIFLWVLQGHSLDLFKNVF